MIISQKPVGYESVADYKGGGGAISQIFKS